MTINIIGQPGDGKFVVAYAINKFLQEKGFKTNFTCKELDKAYFENSNQEEAIINISRCSPVIDIETEQSGRISKII